MSKIKNIFSNLIYMFRAMWDYKKSLFWGKLVLAFLGGIITPLNTYIIKVLIDYVTLKDFKASAITIGIFALSVLSYGIIRGVITRSLGVAEDLFRNYLVFQFNSKTVNMDYEILFIPDMMQKKNMASQAIHNNRAVRYLDIAFSCISSFISLFSVMYLLSAFSWWVYLVILLISAFKIITVASDKKKRFNNSVDMAPINTEISYYMSMLIDEAYVNDMRMYSIADWAVRKYNQCMDRSHHLMVKLTNSELNTGLIRTVLGAAESVFLYGFATIQVIFYGLSFANFTLITSTFKTFSDSISNIARGFIDFGENSAHVQFFREYMTAENVIAVPGKGTPADQIAVSSPIFELKDVSFKYPGASTMALENVNLSVEEGKFYVVVGANGAGKTTLTKLICRLYDVTDGSLEYMGTNIKDIEYQSYRNNIGIVFQDYKYYCLTIAENVVMGEFDGSPETEQKILDALTKAGLGPKIESLPLGIRTPLGKILDKNGVLLSGGELQKLALARVLYKDSPIVILDEPSSALDAFAEDELIQTFNSALKGKTVFYISHRLSVAKYADKVIHIGDKKILGFDTHQNLLKESPEYNAMYTAQAKHYTN